MQLTCVKCWKAGSELCTPSLMPLVTLLIRALKVTSFLETTLWWKPFLLRFLPEGFFYVCHMHVVQFCVGWLFLSNPVQKGSRHNSSETLNKSIWEEIWLWQSSRDRMDTSPLMYCIYKHHLIEVLVFWFNFQFHPGSRINCRAPLANWPVSLTSELWRILKWVPLLWWIFFFCSVYQGKK